MNRVATGWLAVMIVAATSATSLTAERGSPPSDRLSRSAIFAEQHVAESALDVHQRAMSMAGERRYEFLAKWILPGEDHATLRLPLAFTQTNPAPPVDEANLKAEAAEAIARRQTGGELVSPVFDLLDAAKDLGRLDEVHERVNAWQPGPSRGGQVGKLALLLLIELAREDVAAAQLHLEQLLRLPTNDVPPDAAPTSAELLVFYRGLEHAPLREAVGDALVRCQPWLLSEYERSTTKLHVAAMLGRVRAFQRQSLGEKATPVSVAPMKQWFPASRTTANTRGAGNPAARWDHRPGYVENMASHDEDYLYFAAPLLGDYEVECEVTGFEWRDSHLMVAGTWVAPVYTHTEYDHGDFLNRRPRVGLAPRLTNVRDWIQYRTVVRAGAEGRAGTATTYFNGRKVCDELLPPGHEPWLAIRSSPQHDGAARNLRITGQPVIPREVRLSVDETLFGWLPYFDGAEIGASESLLRYQRPMFEDGTIEYEFFYAPEEMHTHPAIDRLAFLLEPGGVRLHWVSDGRHDRSGLDPLNAIDEPANRRGGERLPLRQGEWNRLQFRLAGDLVTLVLNGQIVYERQLEATNQRTFGLFHLADQTESRVREVVWRGDWPRELPPLKEQELFIDETGFLDERLPELPAVFSHDFVNEGLPVTRFTVTDGEVPANISANADGLLASRQGTGGYRNATVAPLLKIEGDFDVTASFDQLVTDPRGQGSSNIMLIVTAETEDESLLLRRQSLHRGDQQLVQCVRVRQVDGDKGRSYFAHRPAESIAGTLRLARRGARMYYLFAENDSSQFRLLGHESFPTDAIKLGGVRLAAQIDGEGGSTSVVWKRFTVRAEQLSGLAAESDRQLLAELNQQRDKLAGSFSHDFTKRPPDDSVFYRWADRRNWDAADQGLPIVHPGTDDWSSAGASLLKQIDGDFDISIQFDVQQLDAPAPGKHSAVYLQVELADAVRTQVSLMVNDHADRAKEVLAQIRVPNDRGGYDYLRLGGLNADSAESLRVARRGKLLYCIATAEAFGGERVIAQAEIGDAPLRPSNTRILVHSGGAGRESRVVWKALDVRAERLQPDALPVPPAQPKGVIESLFDLLR